MTPELLFIKLKTSIENAEFVGQFDKDDAMALVVQTNFPVAVNGSEFKSLFDEIDVLSPEITHSEKNIPRCFATISLFKNSVVAS